VFDTSRGLLMTEANERSQQPSSWWIVRVYLTGAGEAQVYTRVKHVWWSAGNTVLTILHYYEDGSFRYVNWPRENVHYYTRTLDCKEII
jgi:hypothetical protein